MSYHRLLSDSGAQGEKGLKKCKKFEKVFKKHRNCIEQATEIFSGIETDTRDWEKSTLKKKSN